MKSVTKYISLLVLAIVAVSACGGLAALAPYEHHTLVGSEELNYLAGSPAYIDDSTELALNHIFMKKGLITNTSNTYFSVDKPYSPFDESKFITFNKGNLLIQDVVSVFDSFDNDTKTANFNDTLYTITVYQ